MRLTSKTSSYFSYDYKAFDEAKFLADYKEMDTSFLDDGSQDLNGKFDTFLLNLHNLVNKHCPQKKLNKRALKLKNKPWINFQIQRMMKIRDSLFQQFKSTKSPNDLKAYKQFRNRIVNEIRESKKSYFHQYFDEHKDNMKMLWKGIKNIISIRPGNFDSVRFLKEENGSKISDPMKIANEFNNYFTNVADNITKRIPRTPKTKIPSFPSFPWNSRVPMSPSFPRANIFNAIEAQLFPGILLVSLAFEFRKIPGISPECPSFFRTGSIFKRFEKITSSNKSQS